MTPIPGAAPNPPALRVADWEAIPDLVHGFFGRLGGVSGGPWATLNVSERVGDDAAHVAANVERIRASVSRLSLARMQQVHGARVVRIEDAEGSAGEADGLLTVSSGIGLAVLTADCVPMLCVAPSVGAVMALHAGWRGTLEGIAAAGLATARTAIGVEPSAWRVALGPAIGGCCYEVESHIGNQFVGRWGAMPDAWQAAGPHGQLDLRATNRHILVAQGVPDSQIVDLGPCTSCGSDDYFSHRRSNGRAGRQLSVIGWADRAGRVGSPARTPQIAVAGRGRRE